MRPYPRGPLWYVVRSELLKGDEYGRSRLEQHWWEDQDRNSPLWVSQHQLEQVPPPQDADEYVVREFAAVRNLPDFYGGLLGKAYDT